ncbi:hypothetical protein [Streptomyces sp. NPDC088923]|uniref:hypothetical protein n=1 Tax=Streptomyces sp. NPDC088923 TaxID=3365913 RepID=UPI0038098359
MRKILTCGLLAAAAFSAAAPAPAFADNGDNFGGDVSATKDWNFSAADVCIQELAVVPALSDWFGNHKNNCSNGNAVDHSGH